MTAVKTALATILLVFLLVPAPLISADREDETVFETGVFVSSMINGKSWIKLDRQSKIMYLIGVENGAGLLIAEMDSAPNEEGNARAALPALERLMIKGFKFSDIMEEIDRFYEQASNRRIPVVDAYRYVLKKFKGASPEELAAAQSALRKKYNR
jgi:hypothetical protein